MQCLVMVTLSESSGLALHNSWEASKGHSVGIVQGKFWSNHLLNSPTQLCPESVLVKPKAFKNSSPVCSGFLTPELG